MRGITDWSNVKEFFDDGMVMDCTWIARDRGIDDMDSSFTHGASTRRTTNEGSAIGDEGSDVVAR